MNGHRKITPAPKKKTDARRGFLLALGAALVVLPLAGCGRKAAPSKPKESKFPHDYPTQ